MAEQNVYHPANNVSPLKCFFEANILRTYV
jgi:hypothetical protein